MRRASLIPLDAQITESLDHLALLTGREPGALDAMRRASHEASAKWAHHRDHVQRLDHQ
jgi:hypothetical protein